MNTDLFIFLFWLSLKPIERRERGCADSQTPTLAGRRRRVHLQPLAEATRQNLAAHQREARVASVPDDVACGEEGGGFGVDVVKSVGDIFTCARVWVFCFLL